MAIASRGRFGGPMSEDGLRAAGLAEALCSRVKASFLRFDMAGRTGV